jgi:small conductance mechanosensitive channel
MNEDQTQHVVQLLNELDQTSYLQIALIVAGAWLLSAFVQKTLPWMAQRLPGGRRLGVLRWIPVIRLLILIVAMTLVVSVVLNPSLPNMVAILSASALAIGFAFKDYVNGLIAGLVALFERPYRPGDWIKVDDAYGEVKSVGLRALRIVTPDDTVVTIPHSKLWDTNIYNANVGNRELLCVVDFYLDPLHDAKRVRQRLHDVAITSPYLQIQSPIAVIVSERFWHTHYQIKAYPIDARQQFQFMSDITVRAKAALSNLGVEPAKIPPPFMLSAASDDSLHPQ